MATTTGGFSKVWHRRVKFSSGQGAECKDTTDLELASIFAS